MSLPLIDSRPVGMPRRSVQLLCVIMVVVPLSLFVLETATGVAVGITQAPTGFPIPQAVGDLLEQLDDWGCGVFSERISVTVDVY